MDSVKFAVKILYERWENVRHKQSAETPEPKLNILVGGNKKGQTIIAVSHGVYDTGRKSLSS